MTFQFEDLLSEETKGSRIGIPMSLYNQIKAYQDAYKAKYNRKISREHVMIKMMNFGCDRLDAEASTLKAEALQS